MPTWGQSFSWHFPGREQSIILYFGCSVFLEILKMSPTSLGKTASAVSDLWLIVQPQVILGCLLIEAPTNNDLCEVQARWPANWEAILSCLQTSFLQRVQASEPAGDLHFKAVTRSPDDSLPACGDGADGGERGAVPTPWPFALPHPPVEPTLSLRVKWEHLFCGATDLLLV